MSDSFSEPASNEQAEDVESDDGQVEPDADDEYVGRVAGDDEGYAGDTGAEARSEDGS
jgi:hypothetical protein